MKYKEITEYRPVKGLGNNPFPKFNKKDFIGKVSTKIGTFNIYKKEINDLIYVVTGPSPKDKEINSWLILTKIKKYLMAVHAESAKPGNRIISNLFMELKYLLNAPIISDYDLTISGEQLWLSFEKNYPQSLKILSFKTDEIFSLADVSSSTNSDGVTVKHPKNDISEPEKQNWFFILESSLGKSTMSGEVMTESFNLVRRRIYFI